MGRKYEKERPLTPKDAVEILVNVRRFADFGVEMALKVGK
jgi:hypothetical protein